MPSSSEDVLERFSKYQRRLYLYIHSILPNEADVQDVLQNTNIVVWQKISQFQPGTDFRAWVYRICYFEICKFRDRNRRSKLSFSPELLDELSTEYCRHEDLLESRHTAELACVEQLPAQDRDLLNAVYGRGIDVPQLARQMGRQPTSIYRSLRRIRQWLHDCIERAVRREAHS